MNAHMKKFFNIFSTLYWRLLKSPEAYARHLGVKVGEGCLIATRNWSSEPFLITLGNNVQLTNGVSIHTHGGGNCVRNKYPDFDAFGKVIIEDWAYIGAYSQIMPGVTIGEGSLVAAGSVVTKSVPPYTVVGGNPAKVLCSIDEYLAKNMSYNLNTKSMPHNLKKELLLSLPEDKFIHK